MWWWEAKGPGGIYGGLLVLLDSVISVFDVSML